MSKTKKEDRLQITISSWTVIKVILILAGAFLIYTMVNFVVLVLVALLLAALMEPFAELLARYRVPRGIAVLLIYLFIFLLVAGVVVLIVPDVLREATALLVQYAPQLNQFFGTSVDLTAFTGVEVQQDLTSVVTTLQESGVVNALPEVFGVLSSVFGSLLAVSLVLFLAFYMVVEDDDMMRGLKMVTPKRYHELADIMLVQGRKKLGHWLRGQLLIMLIVGLVCYAILSLLGVPFALVLAIMAGLFDVFLYIGPFLAAIPAIVIGFSVSPLTALLVGIGYFLVQQIEGNLLTPNIMKHVAGLNPVLSIIALVVGFEIAGVVGAIISIPLTMVLLVFLREWLQYRKNH